MKDFATRYTAAWRSQDAASVASFFSESGSLRINDGTPSVGRPAITAAVQGFMTAFPDLVVVMDSLSVDGDHAVYHWTLTGTNTGPGGTGKAVRLSGREEWTMGADGLIASSLGHFDEAEYKRQLAGAMKSGCFAAGWACRAARRMPGRGQATARIACRAPGQRSPFRSPAPLQPSASSTRPSPSCIT